MTTGNMKVNVQDATPPMNLLHCNADYRKECGNKKVESVTSSVTRLIDALQCGDPHRDCRRTGTDKHTLHCPAHDRKHASLTLTVQQNKVLLHCFAGCSQDAVIDALQKRGLWGQKNTSGIPYGKARYSVTESGLTLAALAEARKLPVAELRGYGLSDSSRPAGRALEQSPNSSPIAENSSD